MPHTIEKPFDRSYWVVPGKFLAGCYPGSRDPQEAQEKLAGLLRCGIRFVVNLMEEHEMDHGGEDFIPYESTITELARGISPTVVCVRRPIRDLGVPTQGEMIGILNDIDGAIERGLPVYVHCWGGVGRTGTVVGCWLARHGIASGPDVLERIASLRVNEPKANRPSPETGAQRRMVTGWAGGR